jgi:hypothetical protein
MKHTNNNPQPTLNLHRHPSEIMIDAFPLTQYILPQLDNWQGKTDIIERVLDDLKLPQPWEKKASTSTHSGWSIVNEVLDAQIDLALNLNTMSIRCLVFYDDSQFMFDDSFSIRQDLPFLQKTFEKTLEQIENLIVTCPFRTKK